MVFLQESIDSANRSSWHVFHDNGYPVEPIERFLRAKIVAPNTENYRSRYLFYWWQFIEEQELDWRDIRPTHRDQFLDWYSKLRYLENGSYLSKPTLEIVSSTIKIFYDFLMYERELTSNATIVHLASNKGISNNVLVGQIDQSRGDRNRKSRRQRGKRRKDSPPQVLSEEQFALLMEAITNPTLKLMVFLLRYLGLRKAELLGVRYEDFKDGEKRLLHIVARHDPDRPKVRAKGASHRLDGDAWDDEQVVDRILPMSWLLQFQGVFSTYIELRDAYISRAYKFFRHNPSLPYFIDLRNGKPLSYSYPYNMLLRECAKVGFRATPHMLRHTFATQMLQRLYQANPEEIFFGVRTCEDRIGTAQIVQEWLGHSDIETTLDIYCHLFDVMDMDVYMEQLTDGRYTTS